MIKDVYKETPKPSLTENFGSLVLAILLAPLVVATPLAVIYGAGILFVGMSSATFGFIATIVSSIFVAVVLYNAAATAEKNKKPIIIE